MEVTTRKTTKNEAKKLYNELIQKDIDTVEREKVIGPKSIISWIFSIMQAQYLLVLIYITKMCLKKQCMKEALKRE